MRIVRVRPRLRVPLALTLAGLLLVVLTVVLGLRWIPYTVGAALMCFGVLRMLHRPGSGSWGTPLTVVAVLAIGCLWFARPQGWGQPGFGVTGRSDVLVGRIGNTVVIDNHAMLSGRKLPAGTESWHHHRAGPAVLHRGNVYVRLARHPRRADVWALRSGKRLHTKPWPFRKAAAPGPASTADLGLLPRLENGERVLSRSSFGRDYARLVATTDHLGDPCTRLDVVAGDHVTSYLVRGVDRVSVRQQVALLGGARPRVLDLDGA